MADALHALYQRLPAPARSVAASLRGLYLRHWRAGPDFADRVAEALDRDHWEPARRRAWQEERLARLLHRAATRVPYYRRHWEERRRRGDGASFEVLANWPVLEKDAVRREPHAFVADDRDPRRMYHERTSGTTGKPLDIWRTRATLTRLYALAQARTLHWAGIAPDARYARLGGQLVVPARETRPPFWVWNAPMRQLYMSTFHLSPALLPHYLDALARFRIRYLAGYTSSLVALAHAALRSGRSDLAMLGIFTNAEGIDAAQRAIIQDAFGAPVRETYGQAEMVAAATECSAGRLHLWPEAGVVEVHDGDLPAAPDTTGEFICTGLLNVDMPLIRYRIGDRGRLAREETTCECGRTLASLDHVEGRVHDLLLTRDGRRIFWLNPVFYGLPVRESQIVQQAFDRVTVRLAPDDGFDVARDGATIRARLTERLGEVDIAFDLVDQVPRTRSGKLRHVVCELAS